MNDKHLKILLVDDEDIVHQTIAPYLEAAGHFMESVYSGGEALKKIAETDYDLAIMDVRMPGMDGFETLARTHSINPELSVVILTGHGNMDMAIQALRLGAVDFLSKPVKLPELEAVLEKSSKVRELKKIQKRLRQTISEIQNLADLRERGGMMIAESTAMQDIKEQIKQAVEARCDTILIHGDTGSGKEVVAKEIHNMTGPEEPFIAVSCPAMPETLVESELFGHVKGSFTGANNDKAGCFELAHCGTLFLDEVGDLSESAQAKLLRVLETRAVRRVGGSKEVSVDVRVVAATNRSLEDMVKKNKFREDLYYRLAVFHITVPPLRERPEDVIALAVHFLDNFNKRRGVSSGGFTREARDVLLSYEYPGNARELRNIVERAAILCKEGMVGPEHLHMPKPSVSSEKTVEISSKPMADDEKSIIIEALERTKWNRKEAADFLDMPYSTLRYKIKKYEIS